MGFSEAFSRFLCRTRFSDLSSSEVATARGAFLDTLATCLAGAKEEPARKILSFLRHLGHRGPSVVAGTPVRTQAAMAALANGVFAHCLDYDDVNHPMMAHPSAVLVPVVISLADVAPFTGREALVAYAVGLELGVKLGRILNPEHYEKGWHATSTLGTVAAAATAARLLRLDPEKTSTALGLAASLAGGLRRNFGTMAKPFHAGHAARCGLESASLAAQGLTACREIFEGPMGFLEIYGREPDPEQVEQALYKLGNPFELSASGLAIKQYPCCAGSHPALDAILILRSRARKPLEELDRVVLRVDPLVPRMMIHDRPATPLEAKFSLRSCAAAALLDGRVNLASFTRESLLRSDLTRWMERIEIRPDLEKGIEEGQIPTRAEAAFLWRGGECDRHRIEMPLGNPQNPLPEGAVRRKFEECALLALPRRRVQELLGLLENLEDVEDFREITRMLCTPRSRRTGGDAR